MFFANLKVTNLKVVLYICFVRFPILKLINTENLIELSLKQPL